MSRMKEVAINKMNEEKCFRCVITGSKRIFTKYVTEKQNGKLLSSLLTDEEVKSLGCLRHVKYIQVDPISHRKVVVKEEPVKRTFLKKECAVCGSRIQTNVILQWKRTSDEKIFHICALCAEADKVNEHSVRENSGSVQYTTHL